MFSLIFGLIFAISTIVILVDAFKKSLLTGFICLLCGLYYIWYALFEFKHEHKLILVLCSFVGGGVAGLLGLLRR